MLAVTTFPEWGWDVYAKRCIETWVKRWPGSVLAYHEGQSPPVLAGVEFRPLSDCQGHDRFLARDVKQNVGFLHDVKRFCHKVFAQLDAMENHEKFWWIDADVEMKQEVPSELIEDVTDRAFVSFLGRNSYTETGVIAFNQSKRGFEEFKRVYRAAYDQGGIFSLPYWTDCHAFDYARNGGGHNLTPLGQGFDNVLRTSVLGPYMEHHKGKLKLQLEERCA